jgi:hypothetical protein
MEGTGRGVLHALVAAVVVAPGLIAIGLLVWLRTENGALAVGVVAATVLLVGGIVWFQRRGATNQVRTAVQTGRIDLDALFDLSSLPGNWPQDARRTLGVARDTAPAMPVRLTTDESSLHLRKTKYGSRPFTAQIALCDVVTVEAGGPKVSRSDRRCTSACGTAPRSGSTCT